MYYRCSPYASKTVPFQQYLTVNDLSILVTSSLSADSRNIDNLLRWPHAGTDGQNMFSHFNTAHKHVGTDKAYATVSSSNNHTLYFTSRQSLWVNRI